MNLYDFISIIVYVNDSEILVLTFFSLSILFLEFLESIWENVNDTVCLSFYLLKSIQIFFTTIKMIQFKLSFIFLQWNIKTSYIKKYYNIKHQVADNNFKEFCCLISWILITLVFLYLKQTQWFFPMEIFSADMGKVFKVVVSR